jgi:CheY-like chemotaxis protein
MDVVLIDDNERQRRILTAIVEATGAHVRAFPDGETALADIARLAPDLILQDIEMPGLHGLDLMAEIRARYGASIPVAAVTSRADDGGGAVHQAGFDWVLPKPISAAAIVALLHEVRLAKPGNAMEESP